MLPATESSRAAAALLFVIALAGALPVPVLVPMAQLSADTPSLTGLLALLYGLGFGMLTLLGGIPARAGSKESLLLAASVSFGALVLLILFPRFAVLLFTQTLQGAALALAMQSYRVYRGALGSDPNMSAPLLALTGSVSGLGISLLTWTGDFAPWSYWLESIMLGCALALFTRAEVAPGNPTQPWVVMPPRPTLPAMVSLGLLASPAGVIAVVIPWQLARFGTAHMAGLAILLWLGVMALAIATPGQGIWMRLARVRGGLMVCGYGLLTFGTWTGYIELVTLGALLSALALGVFLGQQPMWDAWSDGFMVAALLLPGAGVALLAQASGVTVALIIYGVMMLAAFFAVRSTRQKEPLNA